MLDPVDGAEAMGGRFLRAMAYLALLTVVLLTSCQAAFAAPAPALAATVAATVTETAP